MFPALHHDPRVLRFVPRPATRAASARRAPFRQRVLILGRTPLAERIVQEVDARPFGRRTVVGVVEEGSPGPLRDVIAELRPDVIVVALVERRGRTPVSALLESCIPHGVAVEEAGEFYERITGKLAIESLRPTSILFSRGFRPSRIHRLASRAMTFAIALAGFVALAPLMALIALAIKLDSPGPVLFRQERAGLHRRPFTLLKFRTMRQVAAHRSEWAADNGYRITRVGRWLRHLRLDELPQFINMLRGEMNLVGPRPHPVSNLGLFTLVARNLNDLPGASIGYYQLRSLVPPGLTGWAQVRYGYANNLEEEIEKLRFDLYYVKHASPLLDLRILARTAMNLLAGRMRDGSARAALLCMLAVAAASPAAAQPAVASNTAAAAAVPGEYVIGPEDVLDVAVWNNTAISRTVPVRPDGRISLPLVNDVQAAGLTPSQLKAVIRDALTPYIAAPEVSLIVQEVNSFKVTVMGEVKTPGRYDLRSAATVVDVLALAGGFTDFADRDDIVILRRDAETTRALRFDYTKVGRGRDGRAGDNNPAVRPGDIILVR